MLVDQLTKVWAVASLSDGPIDLIGETLRFRLSRNPGAAFSTFAEGGVILGVIAAGVAVAIALLLPRIEIAVDRFAMALIMGGALGNLADRMFRADGFLDGAVVDFVDFSFWPTFNVADSAISIGVVIMLISAFVVGSSQSRDARQTATEEQSA